MATNNTLVTRSADILVVDDVIENLKLLTEILTEAGYRVRPADGPHVALESALAHPPSLILLDVRMPEMDGFELCRRLKQDERTQDVPIIFVSALQDVEDRVQGFEVGGVDFVSKPFQESEVLARVRTHLQLRSMQLHLEEMVAERTAELREANQVIRESEERFRATFEQAAVGIALVALDGRFLRLNQKFSDITGYSGDEMLERTFQDITHPDDLDTDLAYVRGLLAGEIDTYDMEKRYLRRDGEIVGVNLTVSLLRQTTGEPDYFIAVVEDITERKKLQEERDRILNTSQDMICIAGMDGYFRYLNPAWGNMLGYTSEELLTRPFLDFIHPDDHARNDAEIERLAAGHQTVNFENRYIHKDGSVRYISWTATPILDDEVMYCIGRDVTERRETEAALEQARIFTDNLIDTANVIIIGLDTKGDIHTFNPAAEKITGYKKEELEGENWFEVLVPKEKYPQVWQEHNRLLTGGIVQYYENPILTKDGEERIITWSNNKVSVQDETIGTISFGIDITARKQAEEALIQSEEQFRSLVEQSPFSIQIMNPDGSIENVNQAFMDLWGISEELRPEILEKYNMLEDAEAALLGVMPLIEKAFNGEAVILPTIEYDAAKALDGMGVAGGEGNKRWIQSRLYPVKNSKKEVVKVVDMEEDITERIQTEREIRAYQQKLKALATELILAEERERRRIAADLHDEVGQSLALARIQLTVANDAAPDPEVTAMLDDVSDTIRRVIQDTRDLVFDLSSPLLNELGLVAALGKWLEEEVGTKYNLQTELIDVNQLIVTDEDIRAILFRNTRELLTNAVKHAQASKVIVRVKRVGDTGIVIVEDDGIGFDSLAALDAVEHSDKFGLFSIQERMADLGGALELISEPGQGCSATLTAPLDRGLI